MAFFLPMLLAASTVMKMGGDIMEGEAAEDAANRKAAAGERNAQLIEAQAVQDEMTLRYQYRKIIGQGRASVGASGVTMEGSPMEVLRESAANLEYDALNIQNNAYNQARSYRLGAADDRAAGSNARANSYFGAASSLLEGGVKYAMTQK